MSRLLQLHPQRLMRLSSPTPALLAIGWLLAASGCGNISCPAGLSNADGVCVTVDPAAPREPQVPGEPDAGMMEPSLREERCDGVDNDGNDAIDEPWPELGQPCGEGGGRGACVLGEIVCAAHGRGVVCKGAVGPTVEVCDGKDNDCDGIVDNGPAEVCDGDDNDCDGLIDEGVLSVKQEQLGERATVATIDHGFAVARALGSVIRIETYHTDATRTGYHDEIESPSADHAFLESDASGGRFLVALGQHRFHVVEARIDAEMVPVIVGSQELHDDWDQGIDWGIYEPPYHPRVSASPPRFLGHRDLITFALTPFGYDGLGELAAAPTAANGVPYHAYFDSAGAFAVWEQYDNVRAGWLLDGGELLLEIDVGRGSKPAIALAPTGPAVAYLQGGKLLLSELAGVTLQCAEGRFCDTPVEADPIAETATTAMGLAYHEASDSWVIAASEQLLVVGRGESGPLVQQSLMSRIADEPPTQVDVVVSGGTAAIVQSGERGDTALTFMGCF
jgi:hypothetical protein